MRKWGWLAAFPTMARDTRTLRRNWCLFACRTRPSLIPPSLARQTPSSGNFSDRRRLPFPRSPSNRTAIASAVPTWALLPIPIRHSEVHASAVSAGSPVCCGRERCPRRLSQHAATRAHERRRRTPRTKINFAVWRVTTNRRTCSSIGDYTRGWLVRRRIGRCN